MHPIQLDYLLHANSAIYIEWNEETSEELPGWYYAIVKEYFANGQALVEYTDSSTELIDLQLIQWIFTRKGQNPFPPMDKSSPERGLEKKVINRKLTYQMEILPFEKVWIFEKTYKYFYSGEF